MGRPSNRSHSALRYLSNEARLFLRDNFSRLKIKDAARLRDLGAPLFILTDKLREKLSVS